MDEPKMGFFARLYNSIAGFSNYKYFIKQKTGRAVVYLLLLSLVLSAVSLILPVYDANKAVNEIIKGFDTQVPNFTFENGKLSVEGNMPIIIGDGASSIIIDTSGKTDETILDNYDNAMLITQDRIIQKNFANKQVTDFSLMRGFNFNKDSVRLMLPFLKLIAGLILFFGIILYVCVRFISVLFISLIGLIINAVRNTNLPYRDIFKISAYSLTLPIFIATLLTLVVIPVPYFWVIYCLIAGVYVWGAINAIKKDMEMPSHSEF